MTGAKAYHIDRDVSDDPKPRNLTQFRLTTAVAEKRIREAAASSSRVIFGNHARERMREREIDEIDVLRILRAAAVVDDPVPAEVGEWKCKLVRQMKGSRSVGVVAIILRNGSVFIKTVEWEDVR